MNVNEASGNQTDEWMQGYVKVKIYNDAYNGKSQEEQQRILDRLSRTCWSCAEAIRKAGKDI